MIRTLLAAAICACGIATPAFAQHEGDAFLAAYDANRDGTLTRAEYDAGRAERFKATDANGDGSLSEAEYVAEFSGRFEKDLAASNSSEEKKTEARQRQIRQTHVRFGILDADKDGQISQAEYRAIADRTFAEQDADKDGMITARDVAATDARRKEWRAQAD